MSQATMRDELETMIAAWQDAWFTKNAAAIDTIMADDYVYVAPNGAVMDRAAILGIVSDPTYGLTGGTHTEKIVVMLGDTAALVRHRWQGTGTFRGQRFVDDHRIRDDLRPFERPMAHSVRALLGYWCVTNKGGELPSRFHSCARSTLGDS